MDILKVSKKRVLLLLMLVVALSFSFCSQNLNWTYQKIPAKYESQFNKKSKNTIPKAINAYAIVDDFPSNYVKDASIDYTEIIQKALDAHREVIFPNFPVLINAKGLSLSSNSTVFFDKKSKLKLKPNALGQYEILRIHDVENVVVYNANIEGDKESHTAKDGEWGMGISIRGTKNIWLYNSIVKSCWGDGVYLGITKISSNNINVNITNTLLDSNRRNGMSIIAAENLWVNGLIVANTHGTSPMAGIDIEPDMNSDIIKNLNFSDIDSFNNDYYGFLVILSKLSGEISHKDIKINIKNFKSVYGLYGISFDLGPAKEHPNTLKGFISMENINVKSPKRSDFYSYESNEKNTILVRLKSNTLDIVKTNKAFGNAKNISVSKQ